MTTAGVRLLEAIDAVQFTIKRIDQVEFWGVPVGLWHRQIFVVLCLLILLTGCFPTKAVLPISDQQALGSFTVSSESLGQTMLMPSSCSAGDRQFFLGADLEDRRSGLVLRLVVNPLEGPAVRVFPNAVPFEKSVVFRRNDCKVFHFSLDPTGWRLNRIYDYSLTLQLDCTRDGESIQGNASVAHCH